MFNAGDRLYTDDGHEVEYVNSAGDKHAVREVMCDEDGNEIEGRIFLAERLHSSPPTAKLSDEVARLNTLIAEKQAALRECEAKVGAIREAAARDPKIAALIDMLDGKNMFFADLNDGTVTEVIAPRKHRQFSITAERRDDGMVFWISRDAEYRDSCHVEPFQTREQAVARAGKVIAEMAKKADAWTLGRCVSACNRLGIPVPDGVSDRLRVIKIAEAEKAVKDATDTLARANAARMALG